jgi:hypothetical protein
VLVADTGFPSWQRVGDHEIARAAAMISSPRPR